MKQLKDEEMPQEVWRYAELYKVSSGGRDPIIVAAFNVIDALRKAAEEWGIGEQEARESAEVSEPSALEIVQDGIRRGKSVRMVVRHPEHKDAHVLALCRLDAILQACACWEVLYGDIYRDCRVGVERRVPVQ